MATPTKDLLVKGNLVMHDHSLSDLGVVLDTRYLKLDATNSMSATTLITNLNADKLDGADLSTDGTLASNSDVLIPSQKAVKTYTDALIPSANALVYKGTIDCSTNPNYPAADAGWLYIISVAGKIGGVSGIVVEVGDMCICNTDSTASGDQATVGTKWNIIEKNIVGAVTGPASSTDGNVVLFDGVTGKVIKDSGLTLSGTNTGDVTITDTNSINLSLTGQALTADLVIQDTTSVDLVIDAAGLKATVLPAGVDHGGLAGLTDDDHTQYFLANGTRNMTGAIKVVTNLDKFALYENDVAEADAFLKLTNSTTTPEVLAPRLWLKSNKTGSGTGSQLLFDVSSDEVTDTGQVADISMRLNNAGPITNRPLLTFSNWTTNIVTLLANGNVGIGTSDPQNDLHIVTDGSQYAGITITSTASGETTGFLKVCDMFPGGQFTPGLSGKSSSTTYAGFRVRGLADTGGIATEIQATNYTENGAIGATDTLLRIRNYNTELVTVLGNGNVGIGTTPSSTLHVAGTIKVVSNGNKFSLYEDDVTETDGFFVLGNATTTANKFVPYLTMKGNQTGSGYATAIVADCNSDKVTDTGPVFHISSRANAGAVTNRTLFTLANYATTVLTIASNGDMGIGRSPTSSELEVAGSVSVFGDDGGVASSLTLTNVFSGVSTGSGTVKMGGTTSRNSVGWVKMYNGTTAIYLPYWTTITG